MNRSLDALLVLVLLSFLTLWGGAAVGAGIRGRRWLPVMWGLLLSAPPIYLGVERLIRLGSWVGLLLPVTSFLVAALAVGLSMPRVRTGFLKAGTAALMVGTFIMCGGAVLGALLYQRGANALSVIVGGTAFMFGAMWFGSGLRQLRDQ